MTSCTTNKNKCKQTDPSHEHDQSLIFFFTIVIKHDTLQHYACTTLTTAFTFYLVIQVYAFCTLQKKSNNLYFFF
jgi:hypothetical protein